VNILFVNTEGAVTKYEYMEPSSRSTVPDYRAQSPRSMDSSSTAARDRREHTKWNVRRERAYFPFTIFPGPFKGLLRSFCTPYSPDYRDQGDKRRHIYQVVYLEGLFAMTGWTLMFLRKVKKLSIGMAFIHDGK